MTTESAPVRGDFGAMGAAGDLLARHPRNPILTAEDLPGAQAVYNAGACKVGNEYRLLATIVTNAPVPLLWVARSNDGVRFRFDPAPLIGPEPGERWVCDPRITCIEGTSYVTHWVGDEHGVRTVVGVVNDDLTTYRRMGFICEPDNRNIVLFPQRFGGRYARLDRPYGQIAPGEIWISFSPDLIHWGDSQLLVPHGLSFQWNGEKVGPGAPPVRTPQGWLAITHGVRHGFFGYCLGCVLLDLEDPTRVLGAAPNAILAPRTPYERVGNVPNVCFSGGVILEPEGELKVYYGGADQCLGLATAPVETLVRECLRACAL